MLCAICKKNLATHRYVLGKRPYRLCTTCLDQWVVEDVLNTRSLYIYDLESRQQYDEALASLDEVLASNRDRDHDGSLARSVARDRSWILLEAGRYEEAEQAIVAAAQLGFRDFSGQAFNFRLLADVREAQGKPHEAITILEEALALADPASLPAGFLPCALDLLVTMTERLEKLGLSVDPKWRGIVEATAKDYYGVPMPTDDNLGKAIITLSESTRGMLPIWATDEEDEEDEEEYRALNH